MIWYQNEMERMMVENITKELLINRLIRRTNTKNAQHTYTFFKNTEFFANLHVWMFVFNLYKCIFVCMQSLSIVSFLFKTFVSLFLLSLCCIHLALHLLHFTCIRAMKTVALIIFAYSDIVCTFVQYICIGMYYAMLRSSHISKF